MAKLTDKQQRFVEEYCVDFNATAAAIRAGYSQNTASEIGYENLRKPQISEKLKKRLQELSLGADETLKAISDIARGSLNDYFTVKQVQNRPQIKAHLSELISALRTEMEDADEFIRRAKIDNPKKLDRHNAEQEERLEKIIKYEIELERNPNAYRFVAGEPELIEVADLDLVKLVQDKEAGKIKSVKHSEHGLNIEMYAADSALANLARIHGLFEKDNEQGKAAPLLMIQTKIIPSEAKIASSEKDVDV